MSVFNTLLLLIGSLALEVAAADAGPNSALGYWTNSVEEALDAYRSADLRMGFVDKDLAYDSVQRKFIKEGYTLTNEPEADLELIKKNLDRSERYAFRSVISLRDMPAQGPCSYEVFEDIASVAHRVNFGTWGNKFVELARYFKNRAIEICEPFLGASFQRAYENFKTNPDVIDQLSRHEMLRWIKRNQFNSLDIDYPTMVRIFAQKFGHDKVKFATYVKAGLARKALVREDTKLFDDIMGKIHEACSKFITQGLGLFVNIGKIIEIDEPGSIRSDDLQMPRYFKYNDTQLVKDLSYRYATCSEFIRLPPARKKEILKQLRLDDASEGDEELRAKLEDIKVEH